MLHYHVWFDLKPEIGEQEAIAAIRTFLSTLLCQQKIAGFRLLGNTGVAPGTVLPHYDALIEFNDEPQFGAAFDELREIGIHTNPHGTIVEMVTNFSADVFKELTN